MDTRLAKSLKDEQNQLKNTRKEIDKAYSQALGVYDTQLQEIKNLQPQYEQSITAGYESQKPILQQGFDVGMANIGLQKEQVGQGRETALSSARRQYEQGLQRSQQMFGGVGGSSTGMASAEILGAETARQMGQARMQSAQNFQQLATAERDLQSQLTNQLQQLEVRKSQDILKARDLFRQEINQINTQRAQLGLNKAQAQLTALQDYNTRKRNLEDYYTQQQATLEQYQRQLKDTRDTWMMQQNYLKASAGGTQVVPDFKKMSDQDRASTIKQLLSTDAGKTALTKSGYEPRNVNGENVIYDPYSGLTIGYSGRRFADYSPNYATKEQRLEQVAGVQR